MDLNLNLMQMVNSLARWVFVALAVYILARCILSLIRAKNPAEVWAYMHMVTYASDRDGYVSPAEEISVPITHWENVIGRAKSCDIHAGDSTLSRNHGILMRGSSGQWP